VIARKESKTRGSEEVNEKKEKRKEENSIFCKRRKRSRERAKEVQEKCANKRIEKEKRETSAVGCCVSKRKGERTNFAFYTCEVGIPSS